MKNIDYIEFHCPHCGKYIYLCVHDIEQKEIYREDYNCSCGKSFKVEYDRVLAELNINTGMYLKDKQEVKLMDIKLIKTSDYSESCNFCGKGEREDIKEVLSISKSNASGLKAIICKKCLEDLYKKGMDLFE